MSDLMTPLEALEYLGFRISARTLARWAADGRITRYKLGDRRVFYTRADLDRMIRAAV